MGQSRERKKLMSSVGKTRCALAPPGTVKKSLWGSFFVTLVAALLVAAGGPAVQVLGLLLFVFLLARPLALWLRPRSARPQVRPVILQALALPLRVSFWALGAWYLLALNPLAEAARNDAFGGDPISIDMDPQFLRAGLEAYWTETAAPFIEIAVAALLVLGVASACFHARRLENRELASTHVELTSLLLRMSEPLGPVLPIIRTLALRAPFAAKHAPRTADPVPMASWLARRLMVGVSAASQTYWGGVLWMFAAWLLWTVSNETLRV